MKLKRFLASFSSQGIKSFNWELTSCFSISGDTRLEPVTQSSTGRKYAARPVPSLKHQSGFTLIELVLVAFLLGVMASIMFGTLIGMNRSVETVEELRLGERTARFVLDRLCRELSSATESYLFRKTKERSSIGLAFFEGKNETEGSSDADSIRFVAASGGQPVSGAQRNNGPVEIRYFLAEMDESMKAPGASENALALVREEHAVGMSDEEKWEATKLVFPISYNIRALNFRYLNVQGVWSDDWSGLNSQRLPQAVEISIVVAEGEKTKPRLYKTAVAITQKIP